MKTQTPAVQCTRRRDDGSEWLFLFLSVENMLSIGGHLTPLVPPPFLKCRRLVQYMINDSDSWGRVEDPIGTLLRQAAFFVVEHPSPATKAELAEAREKDLVAKVSQRVVGLSWTRHLESRGKVKVCES